MYTLETATAVFPLKMYALSGNHDPLKPSLICMAIAKGMIFMHISSCKPFLTRNSSGDEIANMNFLYDDIVHALKIQ